jgi:hypothetical protein
MYSSQALLTTLGSRHPDTGDERDDTRNKDSATTSKILVKRRIGPATYETRA